ncbi:hypothetical protein NQ314_004968 [Rhamnusium bicolor]|uniref:Uncharacterized protein n=1 Tax=Rhamnusium bicolor TaxID=1586634 RepID=A0AAV8ZII9_9CUCU|nr:hypothetical protein NQ314_004968 [Rhamnusium bicolor]
MAPSELRYGFIPEMKYEVRLRNKKGVDLRKIRAEAKRRCNLAAKRMKKSNDKRRTEAKQYKVGDVVLVKRKLLAIGLTSRKMVPKYIDRVQIIEVLGNDRYRVASFSKDKRRFKGIVVNEMRRMGGKDTQDLVRRTLGLMISNPLAAKYSWLGSIERKKCSKEGGESGHFQLAKTGQGPDEKATIVSLLFITNLL